MIENYANLALLRKTFSNPCSRNTLSSFYQKKARFYGSFVKITSYSDPVGYFYHKRKNYQKRMNTERRRDSYVRARQKVYEIISCNLNTFKQKPTFWTFTFDPSLVFGIDDLKHANAYFTDFMVSLKLRSKIKVKYLCVPEFQKSGNVHYHVVFFNLPFIEQDFHIFNLYPQLIEHKVFNFSMTDIWKYGSAKAILLDGKRDIAGYISKYMSKAFYFNHDQKRVYGQKLYFRSLGLREAVEIFDEVVIDKLLESAKLRLISYAEFFARGLKVLIFKHNIYATTRTRSSPLFTGNF